MSSDPKTPGEPPDAPEAAPETPDHPKADKDLYGGVWAAGGPSEDTSGQGSAPRAPSRRHAAAPEPPHVPSVHPVHPCTSDQPHSEGDVYGGVWSSEGPREDASGRGSAPRPPGAKPPEAKSFSEGDAEAREDGPEIAADDAGASARTETPQRRHD